MKKNTRTTLSIRVKVALTVLLSALAFSFLVYVISSQILLKSYDKIEDAQTREHVQRVADGLQNTIDQLDVKLVDWARWDDTHVFVHDKNAAYFESNLGASSLANLEINGMIFVDENGVTVFSRMIDFETLAELPTESILEHLKNHPELTTHNEKTSPVKGLIALPEGAAYIASEAILTSDGEGPIHGSLIFVKFLTDEEIQKLGALTHFDIDMFAYASSSLPEDVTLAKTALLAGEERFVLPVSANLVAGYDEIHDLYGDPILLLRVQTLRPVFQQGRATFAVYGLMMGAVAPAYGLLVLLVLQGLLFSRLSRLNREIEKIGQSRGGSLRVTEDAGDELGESERAMNDMLGKIDAAQIELRKAKKGVEMEVKERTKELHEERARFLASVNSLLMGFAIVDVGGVLLTQNPSLHRIVDGDHELQTLDDISKLLKNDINLMKKLEECTLKHCVIELAEIPFQRKFLRVFMTPVFEDDGVRPLGGVLLIEDITELKAMEREKTEFVSLASHQLRTPLSTVNWYIELLLSGDAGTLNKKQLEFVDEISTGNKRMVSLVNALLNVSRLELGHIVLVTQPVNLQAALKEVVESAKGKAEEQKLTIQETYENLPVVSVDPKYFRMVVDNVLNNALQYTPEGGRVEISLRGIKAGDGFGSETMTEPSVGITISDTGVGIPEAQQKKIFEKLFRADNVLDLDEGGTGLGLYTVKSILSQVGGKIWFSSKENVGTTFFITLPLTGMKSKVGASKIGAVALT